MKNKIKFATCFILAMALPWVIYEVISDIDNFSYQVIGFVELFIVEAILIYLTMKYIIEQ